MGKWVYICFTLNWIKCNMDIYHIDLVASFALACLSLAAVMCMYCIIALRIFNS